MNAEWGGEMAKCLAAAAAQAPKATEPRGACAFPPPKLHPGLRLTPLLTPSPPTTPYLRFEAFQRAWNVKDGLGAGANDSERRAAELVQISGHIHRELATAVHAANATGDKHGHACTMREQHRCGDGGASVPATRDGRRKVAPRALGDDARLQLRKGLKLLLCQTDDAHAIKDSDRRGDRTVGCDDRLNSLCGGQVLWVRHTCRGMHAAWVVQPKWVWINCIAHRG